MTTGKTRWQSPPHLVVQTICLPGQGACPTVWYSRLVRVTTAHPAWRSTGRVGSMALPSDQARWQHNRGGPACSRALNSSGRTAQRITRYQPGAERVVAEVPLQPGERAAVQFLRRGRPATSGSARADDTGSRGKLAMRADFPSRDPLGRNGLGDSLMSTRKAAFFTSRRWGDHR